MKKIFMAFTDDPNATLTIFNALLYSKTSIKGVDLCKGT